MEAIYNTYNYKKDNRIRVHRIVNWRIRQNYALWLGKKTWKEQKTSRKVKFMSKLLVIKNVNRKVILKKNWQKKFLLRKISLRAAGYLSWQTWCLLLWESHKKRRNILTKKSEMSKKNWGSHCWPSNSQEKDNSMADEASSDSLIN